MTTTLTLNGHPVELVELASTAQDPYLGPWRRKRHASSCGYGGYPGYARIRPACPQPCCAERGERVVRYDFLEVVTA